MLTSYIISTLHSSLGDVKDTNNRLTTHFELNKFKISLWGDKIFQREEIFYENQPGKIALLGKIFNPRFLEKLLSEQGVQEPILSDAHLVSLIYKHFGSPGFSYINGCFAVLLVEHDEAIKVFSSAISNYPTYYYSTADEVWITNEVKFLRANPSINLTLKPFEEFLPDQTLQANYTIFNNIKKLGSHCILSCDKSVGRMTIKSHGYPQSLLPELMDLPQDLHSNMEALHSLLHQNIEAYINLDERPVAVSLSGGIDSCVVASYARTTHPFHPLYTFTFGSQATNEFDYASSCAKYVASHHEEIIFGEENFLEGLKQVVYFNEIFDGIFAEVHATMPLIYEKAHHVSSKLLTGFNADNLLGGLLDPHLPPEEINSTLLKKFKRTKWTGEYNPYLANHYNLYENSPYLYSQMVLWALHLNPLFKMNHQQVKYILKRLASQKGLLPETNIQRKKMRLEEGCSSETMFSHFLKLKPGYYRRKHAYVYHLFQMIFEHRVPYQDIDMRELRKKVEEI